MRIIVADDDPVISKLLCKWLESAGHEAIAAFDAVQTLMFARRQVPALIILDIKMPAGSGVDTLKRLEKIGKMSMIPVLVLSGSADPEMPELVRSLGALDFLAKPVDREQLLAAVARILALEPRSRRKEKATTAD